MHPVEAYISWLHASLGAGTPETSGYPALANLLNATTRWKDVPENVWHYTLGGYQVLRKWLSYRESALLGRPLTAGEAQQFTHHTRRIASILALHEELDGHFRKSIYNHWSFRAESTAPTKKS